MSRITPGCLWYNMPDRIIFYLTRSSDRVGCRIRYDIPECWSGLTRYSQGFWPEEKFFNGMLP